MKRCMVLAILVGLFVGVGAGQAQITIKIKESGEGEAALIKRTETNSSKVTVADGDGQLIAEEREIRTETLEYKETILKREAGKWPTKLERAYTKAENSKDGKLEDNALHGKTFIIEKKGDKYVYANKSGKSVEGQAAAALDKDFDKKGDNEGFDKLLLPTKPVKVGESWKIDMRKIAAEFATLGDMELDGVKSTGQGVLVKAYKKDGALFGAMKVKVEMPIITMGEGDAKLKCAAGAKMVVDVTYTGCIDGTSETGTLKLKFAVTGSAAAPGAPNMRVTFNITGDQTEERFDVKK